MQAGGTRVTRQDRAPASPPPRAPAGAPPSSSARRRTSIGARGRRATLCRLCALVPSACMLKNIQWTIHVLKKTSAAAPPRSTRRHRDDLAHLHACAGLPHVHSVCSGLSHRSTGREEMPARKVTSPPEAPVPARSCTGRRRGAPARATASRLAQRPAESSRPVPTFRSNRPDRAEPSQHAPPLPVGPTARLGPSARRRAEAL